MILDKHRTPDGKVSLWDLGDGKEDASKIMMPHIDAAHALRVEPKRFVLVDPDDPETPPVHGGESAGEQNVDLSATADQSEKTTAERDASEFGGESAL